MTVNITWQGIPEMQRRMGVYGDKVIAAAATVAEYYAPILEEYAKTNAPWTDQTANARQSLHTFTEVAEDVVTLYLSHGVEYGIWLEVRWAGKYSIIWPTIEAHLPEISKMLQEIFA